MREPLAGIVGLSGYLPVAGTTAGRAPPGQPAHADVSWRTGATMKWSSWTAPLNRADLLQALGYSVQWHDYPMPHSVCMEEVADLNRWLVQVLANP
jgi:phospholipase/carboxylesterase